MRITPLLEICVIYRGEAVERQTSGPREKQKQKRNSVTTAEHQVI